MFLKRGLFLLVLCHIYLASTDVVARNPRKEADFKIVQTIHGDKYDCVDFYKQPAFDHPALKNHSFNVDEILPNTDHRTFSNLWKNGKGCPVGTVPIKRMTKEDVARTKLITDIYANRMQKPQDIPGIGSIYGRRAVLRTKNNPSAKYYGSIFNVSMWNPIVENDQFSSAELIIQNGGESIIVGWIVYPTLYKDDYTRSFIYTNMATSHCFNTQCPGFVVVRRDFPLDKVLTPSLPGGPTFEYQYYVARDPGNGNWFLGVENDNIIIGFWPNNIFKELSDSAAHIEWGGEVYSPPGVPAPPMGSGEDRLREDIQYDAYFRNMFVLDGSNNFVDPAETEAYTDIAYCYAKDEGFPGRSFGRLFLYTCPVGK